MMRIATALLVASAAVGSGAAKPGRDRCAESGDYDWTTAKYVAGGVAVVAAAPFAAALAVPALMSWTGVVVAGTGTIHVAGGAAAIAQGIAAGGLSATAASAVVGGSAVLGAAAGRGKEDPK